jgi:hypothetical protein
VSEQPGKRQRARDEQEARGSAGHPRGSIRLAEPVAAGPDSLPRLRGRFGPNPVLVSGALLGLSGNASVTLAPLG